VRIIDRRRTRNNWPIRRSEARRLTYTESVGMRQLTSSPLQPVSRRRRFHRRFSRKVETIDLSAWAKPLERRRRSFLR